MSLNDNTKQCHVSVKPLEAKCMFVSMQTHSRSCVNIKNIRWHSNEIQTWLDNSVEQTQDDWAFRPQTFCKAIIYLLYLRWETHYTVGVPRRMSVGFWVQQSTYDFCRHLILDNTHFKGNTFLIMQRTRMSHQFLINHLSTDKLLQVVIGAHL